MGSKTNRKVKSPKAVDVVTVEEVKEEKAEEAKEAGMFLDHPRVWLTLCRISTQFQTESS